MDKLPPKIGNSARAVNPIKIQRVLEIREPDPHSSTRNTNPIVDPVPGITRNTHVRINIRYCSRSVIWTIHDVQGKTRLRDLFELHRHEGGPQPHVHDRIFLQQINQHFKQMDGTEKYCWVMHSQERIMDLNWIFEDNEVWLSCLVDNT